MSKILKNTFIYTLGSIFPQLINFLLLPLITKYMTTEQYGLVSSMLVLQYFLAFFFTLSLESSIVRLYWDYKTEEERGKFLGTIFLSVVLISSAILILLFIFSGLLEKIFSSISFYPYYMYAVLSSYFLVFTLCPLAYFRLKQKAFTFLALSMTQLLLGIALVIWFVVFNGRGAEGMLFGKMIANAVFVPVFVVIALKNFRFIISKSMLLNGLKFSLPVVVTMVASWILNQVDRLFIERYFSLGDVGIYSLSRQLAGTLSIVASAFSFAFSPLFFELASLKNDTDAETKLYRYNHAFILSIIIIWFVISLFSKEAILLFLNSRYHDAYIYIPVVSTGFMIGSISSVVLGNFFQQSKKMKQNMTVGIIGSLITLVLCFFLIPWLGALGAAFVTVTANFAIFLISYFYTKKNCFFIRFNWKSILQNFIPLGFLVFFLNFLDVFSFWLTFAVKAVSAAVMLAVFYTKYKDVFLVFFRKPPANP